MLFLFASHPFMIFLSAKFIYFFRITLLQSFFFIKEIKPQSAWLGVIIFGSVWFLSKQSNQTEIF